MPRDRDADRTPCPDDVLKLIERFDRHKDAYKDGHYNEAQVRREFIDPFFVSLGWDVHNTKGYAEAYKDVIHEDSIKVGGATKAPDYCFRIGGTRKFFVEAKKPSVDVREDVAPAYQLRRYAWTNKLPLSVVTDFEEWAVYDCRIKPKPSDKSSAARITYLTYSDYANKWDEIASIFSRDAILKGSFDKYAESNKRKRGTAEVDKEFLKEIERWRDELARNIALRNENLSVRELNFAVGRTIDRIVFLRMCEDRGIETYAQLRSLVNGKNIYPRMVELYHRADERYNSGLFHFQRERERAGDPDELTPGLNVDDRVLKEIIKSLYYPESPYEFSVLPADILGQVYEQFLGKVIRLTGGHRAVIEEKPEVKKAGGVYYTPTYIVDYIVEQTVGKLLEGRSVKWIGKRQNRKVDRPELDAPLRVLDPACGSGSFLLGAYQRLLQWYTDFYMANDAEGWAKRANPPICQASGVRDRGAGAREQGPGIRDQGSGASPKASWRLTIAERKRILLAHIFGVDIDAQAVEVTKLSLLLKVLEGESQQSLDNQLRLFHERALPDLAENIKCGNSLIGPDFYDNQQMSLLDDDERIRINAFDWKAEFPHVFTSENPGFDAVIGNPPYVRMEGFSPLKEYLSEEYRSHEERADLYAYFLERAITLSRTHGKIGFIVSNKFMRAKYGRPLRRVLLTASHPIGIVDFAGNDVFQGATVRTVVLLLLSGARAGQESIWFCPKPDEESFQAIQSGLISISDFARQRRRTLLDPLGDDAWLLISKAEGAVLMKLRSAPSTLSRESGVHAKFGIKTGLNRAFIIDQVARDSIVAADPDAETVLKPIIFGRDVRRYYVINENRFIIYLRNGDTPEKYPAIASHLQSFRKDLEKRAGSQDWYELQQPAHGLVDALVAPKIVYPIIANECRFAFEADSFYINDKVFTLTVGSKLLLAILNSRVANFYFESVCAALEGPKEKYLEFRAQYVDRFPMPASIHDHAGAPELDRLGARQVELHCEAETPKTPSERATLQRQITATDAAIDRLVYELYGLTEEEIAIVEEATREQQRR